MSPDTLSNNRIKIGKLNLCYFANTFKHIAN